MENNITNTEKFSINPILFLCKAYDSLNETSLDKSLRSLLELRVSQINIHPTRSDDCDLYVEEARKNNISQNKLEVLRSWNLNKDVFSEKEVAALSWCEAITFCEFESISEIKNEMYKHFSEEEMVDISSCISIMNAMNRIANSLNII